VLLVSACLGVFLEGPMGATIFWTILGLANGVRPQVQELRESEKAPLPHRPPIVEAR
jgi:hypothetical protein